MTKKTTPSRREFMKTTAVIGSFSFLPQAIEAFPTMIMKNDPLDTASEKNIIGSYGPWANKLSESPPLLSYRRDDWKSLESWKEKALTKTKELVSSPEIQDTPKATINKKYDFEDLEIEELSWQLPYGQVTEAILLKPKNAVGPLPGVLGLHDHGGNKYFGKRKITRTNSKMHPKMADHQQNYYGGTAWANEIAKRGYVVLVHDTFTFGSRRVLFENMAEIPWGNCATKGMTDKNPEAIESIDAYNAWAAAHEHVMSKSLFCGGTTWPGVSLAEDQCALDVLAARDEVDSNRIGCAGLSGGGLRTVYLGGLDPRIQCAVAVGFMTTWTDFLLYKAYTHTWMIYTPLLPKYLEFPEILGLRAPLPTMTLNNNQDRLFTLSEMKKADKMLQDVFSKAGAGDKYKGGFYDGDHKFDKQMQQDAFDWFDQWLNK